MWKLDGSHHAKGDRKGWESLILSSQGKPLQLLHNFARAHISGSSGSVCTTISFVHANPLRSELCVFDLVYPLLPVWHRTQFHQTRPLENQVQSSFQGRLRRGTFLRSITTSTRCFPPLYKTFKAISSAMQPNQEDAKVRKGWKSAEPSFSATKPEIPVRRVYPLWRESLGRWISASFTIRYMYPLLEMGICR